MTKEEKELHFYYSLLYTSYLCRNGFEEECLDPLWKDSDYMEAVEKYQKLSKKLGIDLGIW